MKRLLISRLMLSGFSCLPALRAAEAVAHVDDPGQLLPSDPPAAGTIEAKLADFERVSGLKVLVQFHRKSPPAEEDKVPGAYMQALAARLGVAIRGVLVVYFADEDDWRVWIGDDLTPVFVGRAGTARELTESGAIHQTKEALLTAARAAGDAAYAAWQKAAPRYRQPTPAQRLRFQTEALLDALIGRLGRK